jgi:hypothetical protein
MKRWILIAVVAIACSFPVSRAWARLCGLEGQDCCDSDVIGSPDMLDPDGCESGLDLVCDTSQGEFGTCVFHHPAPVLSGFGLGLTALGLGLYGMSIRLRRNESA